MISTGLAKNINIICLLAAIAAVLVLPLSKQVWYDETVSILCSKGISHDTHALLANDTVVSSARLEQMNTMGNVYKATILDNGNSFVYNAGLHFSTMLCGNSIAAYMLLSKLCGIATLLAFFALCRLLMKDSIFTGLAILLLGADLNFIGMTHEIRAYEMGTFFITLAGVYFYKFMYEEEKPLYLFLLGIFSVGAVLSHFLSLYAILVFLGYLVVVKKAKLLSVKNIAAIAVPVILVGIYFYGAYMGLKYMSDQNHKFQDKAVSMPFSAAHVLLRSMAMGAIDFKVVFPAFGEKTVAVILSFLLLMGMYMMAWKGAEKKEEKRNLHLLFLLGVSGTIFLAALCFKSGHYTALYNRYHSFCISFATLFTAYALYLLAKAPGVNKLIKAGAVGVVALPTCVLFFIAARKINNTIEYNHIGVAQKIAQIRVTKIDVPDWDDALLIQAVLPRGYKIDYVINAASPYFALYKNGAVERVPLVRKK